MALLSAKFPRTKWVVAFATVLGIGVGAFPPGMQDLNLLAHH